MDIKRERTDKTEDMVVKELKDHEGQMAKITIGKVNEVFQDDLQDDTECGQR